MKYKYLYSFNTKIGTFYIGQCNRGKFHPIFNGESLGPYKKDWMAADDLAGGHTFSIPNADTSRLGFPSDLSGWTKVI